MVNRLGPELRRLRRQKGASLRKVQAETGVSNPYLSQLERGVAENPAPTKLQALADYYEASYLELLEHAGYLPGESIEASSSLIGSSEVQEKRSSENSADLSGLTDQEAESILQYIEFLKSRRGTTSSG